MNAVPDQRPLSGRCVLVSGIANETSLALPIAQVVRSAGAALVCTGLGPTRHHRDLSQAAEQYLRRAQDAYAATVRDHLGAEVPALIADATLENSLGDLAAELRRSGHALDGVVHAIAMDRTIRGGAAKPLLQVTQHEFIDCMVASAYSLLSLVRALLRADVLRPGASIVALSYLGAERVMPHPYRNIGIAKAALERLVRELAAELGPALGVRVNAVRFSPWSRSRAGGAIPGLDEAVAYSAARAPLGNADPESLAHEVAHLLRPGLGVTGEIRHVDGGYNVHG
jgi:enoyl-[acyl-carrier protein] reductase I